MNAPPPRVALLACSVFEREIVPIGEASSSLVECSFFAAEAWQSIPVEHRAEVEGERALRLIASPRQTSPRISEVDVAVLLQAKAAIGAGIHSLLENAGLLPGDLDRVYLAGGFGMHLNVPNAIAMGLLPEFRPEQVEIIGNSSLAGALLALLDRTSLAEMEKFRRHVEVVELNLQDGFEDHYIDHLSLP